MVPSLIFSPSESVCVEAWASTELCGAASEEEGSEVEVDAELEAGVDEAETTDEEGVVTVEAALAAVLSKIIS